ncbi:MAG: hypothetical protein EXS59_01735 [Candidatus Taylorbacteria bacterium]|nr:hypothetical protein [Candidatus Taylorbacteria bacterium]
MTTLERGKVTKFFNTKERMYGFVVLSSKEEVFFHFSDMAAVGIGLEEPKFLASKPARKPAKGDVLLFERSKNAKGFKAMPWCFAADWAHAEKEIAARTVYRLIKQTSEFPIARDPQVEWEGTNTEELRTRFGGVKLGYAYKGGTGGTEKFWFEKKVSEEWVRLEHDDDPRKVQLNLGHVAKPYMPLQVAKNMLTTCSRNALVDDEFGDSEAWWEKNDREVATAYIRGYGASVTMGETDDYNCTHFRDAEGDDLAKLGRPGKVEHNDCCSADY